jgi:hypothetical protein
MNHVEQRFRILQCKCLAGRDSVDYAHLVDWLQSFVREWNEHSRPFNSASRSVTKIMAECERRVAMVA